MQEKNKSLLYASIAVLSWSTVATMFKITLRYLSTFQMLLVASISALLVIGIAMTIMRKWSLLRKLPSRKWVWFALVGLLNPLAYYLVLFRAYDLLPAQVAQPINYFWPIILLVLLSVIGRQRIPAIKYIGMLLSLSGVAIISLGTGGLNGIQLSASGLLLALFSAFLWSLYWIINRLNKNTDSIIALFLTFLSGSIYMVIIALVTDTPINSIPGIFSAIYVGVFEMGVPFLFFGLALRKTDNPALVNQMCYLSPFLSLFFISVFLDEKIYTTTYIGLILIVSGIVFNEYLANLFTKSKS